MIETISELTALGTAILFGSALSLYLCRLYDMRTDHRSCSAGRFRLRTWAVSPIAS